MNMNKINGYYLAGIGKKQYLCSEKWNENLPIDKNMEYKCYLC
jgi:hypothetical protein